ncbi:MAG TPA: amino acid ABC transporter substrate-binding protein [Streptosporangiaceae bacterium]|nr:amino acid ABC transporter substrate-binding protein [Streptosporangiaceae bacterium]
MKPHRTRFLSLTAGAALATMVVAACSSSGSSSSSSSSGSKSPILIGASLSTTGDFSADGQAFTRGYDLWASYVNSHGGLLGRKVKMVYLNDQSDPTTVTTNYTKLIAQNHVDLVFGPFSTLLTVPAAKVAARYGYAFPEGAGGGPSVFALNLPNIFATSPPVADQLVPFADWVASLPASQRPKTAAYPMVNDPFADPMTQTAQAILQKAGVRTVYSKIFPAENPDYKAGADAVAATGAQMVVLGSVDVPTATAFMQAFEQQHYNPKIFAASAGPDQGQSFLSSVGAKNATGIMVPDGWYGGLPNPLSQAMVKAYIAKYGGTASDINADVAEGYSVGEITAAAVTATKSLDNAKIIKYLHSGVTLQTVQGPEKFSSNGQNIVAQKFIFQWQNGSKFVQVLPTSATGSVAVVNPKPNWGS